MIAAGGFDGQIGLVIAAFVLLVIGALVFSFILESKRRHALAALARKLGLRFSPEWAGADLRFSYHDLFRRGHSRKSSNGMAGDFGGRSVEAFDYRYVTGSGKNRTTHSRSCVITRLGFPAAVPHLYIRREGFLDKVAAVVGMDDIDFESAEFSKRYFVKSGDRKFAYDVIDARMMEFLLDANAGWLMEVEHDTLLVWLERRLSPEEIEAGLNFSREFLDRWPEFLVKQLRGA